MAAASSSRGRAVSGESPGWRKAAEIVERVDQLAEALGATQPGPPPTGVRRKVHRLWCCCIKPLLWAAGLGILYVYLNGIVTRSTYLYELPWTDGTSFCVVGNGPGVVNDKGYGEFIDSHDVVVRFNQVVLEPSNYTGNNTGLHVITAGSPKQHLDGAEGVTVYSSWIHDKLAEFAHPYTFPLHAWGARFKEDTGVVGPSSGLLVTKFLSEVFPNSRVSTIGMGEFSSNNMSSGLHYFSRANGTLADQMLWKIESTYSLHHNNETQMFSSLRSTHRNVQTIQSQYAAGVRRAPSGPLNYALGGAPARNGSRGDANSSLRRALRTDGFKLVDGIFTREDAQTMRAEMLTRRASIERAPLRRFFHRIVNPTGLETVDFMHRNRAWYAATSWLSSTPMLLEQKLKPYLEQHFGDETEVDWFFHNDIGINHLSRWHKDRLNNNLLGRYRDDFEALDPWEEGPYDIYKCLIYLQDHRGNGSVGPALDVVPGTHATPPASHGEGALFDDLAPQNESDIHAVAPRLGEVIIFDQRITHRGHSSLTEVDKVLRSLGPSKEDGSDARILVTVGFGLKGSKHLPGFKEGTLARQRAVFFVTEKLCIALEVFLVVLGLVVLRWLLCARKSSTFGCCRLFKRSACGFRWSRVTGGDAEDMRPLHVDGRLESVRMEQIAPPLELEAPPSPLMTSKPSKAAAADEFDERGSC